QLAKAATKKHLPLTGRRCLYVIVPGKIHPLSEGVTTSRISEAFPFLATRKKKSVNGVGDAFPSIAAHCIA
ncbi:hypothetical protein, partial [Paenibacillus lactis]|uniref:hypothetical protein n=1 Tax=Paenibacillus lactis TaxID=228574 RepID=UPI0023F01E8F